MARPKNDIDPRMVEKLACSGCSAEQIGAILDCNERTIQRRFATILKRGRERRNGRLQIELFRRAMNGSDAIAILLAKNWLGMTDRPDVVVNVQQNAIYAELTREQLLASIERAKALEAEAPVGWQPGGAARRYQLIARSESRRCPG